MLRRLAIVALVLAPVSLWAASVTLLWDGSPGTNVVGYSLSYGTNSSSFIATTNAGLRTNLVLSGLTLGQLYYFQVLAYDAFGDVSAPATNWSVVALAPAPVSTPTASVALTWLSNPSLLTVGYCVSFGTNVAVFPSATNAGPYTNMVLRGLVAGWQYYFRAVAYDTNCYEIPPATNWSVVAGNLPYSVYNLAPITTLRITRP